MAPRRLRACPLGATLASAVRSGRSRRGHSACRCPRRPTLPPLRCHARSRPRRLPLPVPKLGRPRRVLLSAA
eukprot:4005100-Prymnesium_polylepis.2